MKRFSRILAVASALAFFLVSGDAHAFGDMSKPRGGGGGKTTPVDKTPVEKAKGPDSYTVSEIHKKSADLDRKKVVVRGRVIKVSTNIMGKNWIHLWDGSGDAEKGTNDLVVTSSDLPAVGNVVTARGTLYKDKDFGSGYKYVVIMEEATLKP